jgi:hypothetical protein
MDVEKLVIPYCKSTDWLIDLEFNVDYVMDVVLSKDVLNWLIANNIRYDYHFCFDQGSNIEVGQSELTFENEQDKLAFVMRWL